MCEESKGVDHHLWSPDSHPADRGICALRSSKPVPRCTAVREEGGELLTEESELKARWASYFEELLLSLINFEPPLFVETQVAVNQLKGGKASGICGMHAELFNTGGNAVLMLLLCRESVLCGVLHREHTQFCAV